MDNIKALMNSFKVTPNSNNYLTASINQFKLGDGRVENLSHPYLDYGTITPRKLANGENLLNSIVKEKGAFAVAKKPNVPFSHFDVKNTKPIKIEKAFGDQIVKSDIQPFHHKNPQKYEYHLDKYDMKDIAMKRLEIENGGTNEFSRIYAEFNRMYGQQFDEDGDATISWNVDNDEHEEIPIESAINPFRRFDEESPIRLMAEGGAGGGGPMGGGFGGGEKAYMEFTGPTVAQKSEQPNMEKVRNRAAAKIANKYKNYKGKKSTKGGGKAGGGSSN